MIRGGVSAKLGDGYEAEWALLEALRVLRGEALSLRVEPFEEDADGFEFRLSTAERVSWHQCKRRRAGGSWTLVALESEGVLASFAKKLIDEGAECVFVSQDRADVLIGLTEKAALVDEYGAFEAALNVDERAGFRRLQIVWGRAEQVTWAWLRRCRVETASQRTLRASVTDICKLLFQADADTCRSRLKTYLEDRLTQNITTDAFRAAVEELDLGWLARLDPTLGEVFARTTDAYLATLAGPILKQPIITSAMTTACEAVFEPENRITVVAGGAGSGKSLLLAHVVETARSRGWPVLAFRIDHFLSAGSAEQIGEDLFERRQSPVSLFGNRYGNGDCLLLIDQLDAISEASGRTGRVREELFRIISDAGLYPGLRVVVACRSYDMERDSRLRRLADGPRRASFTLPPLDWTEAVEPVLKSVGLDRRAFTAREREVLSIPVNLSLLVRLKALGEPVEGELSGVRLFIALVEKRAADFREQGIVWTPWSALHAIARRMSESQELTAPMSVLAAFPGAEALLASSGFIISSAGKVQFAHESFFDHAFADAFVAENGDLLALLRSDEQRLFRRTQVRQILSRLRDIGGREYLRTLKAVMNELDIRYLIRDAVASWLSVVDRPSDAERRLVDEWRTPDHRNELLARTIHASAGWAPALVACGHVSRWIADPERQDEALWILKRAAEGHPDLVEPVLRLWWGGSEERTLRLLKWFDRLHPQAPIGMLEGLYRDLVEAYPQNRLDQKGLDGLVDLAPWTNETTGLSVMVLCAWLERWMKAFDQGHPFFLRLDQDRRHWIGEVAEQQTAAFLEGVMPLLAEGLRRDLLQADRSALGGFRFRMIDGEPDSATLMQFVADNLVKLAVEAPDLAGRYLDLLPKASRLVAWLELRVIAANGNALSDRLAGLIDHAELFEASYGEGPSALSQALAVATARLQPQDRDRLEARILAHQPEIESAGERLREGYRWAIRDLQHSGVAQRLLLASTRPEAWGPNGRRRLAELHRKFGERPLWFSSRGGGAVQSPIPGNRAAAMTDAQWLGAMRRYAGEDDTALVGAEMVGGASQLASDLRFHVALDPERFVTLLENLPNDVIAVYPLAILGGLGQGGSVTGEQVARAVRAAERWSDPEMGKIAAWALQRAPAAVLAKDVLERLIVSAETGSASDSVIGGKRTPRLSTDGVRQLLAADNLDAMNSMNEERGSAYSALGTALWSHHVLLEEVASLLERRIETEPLTSVRMAMIHAINSVCRHDIDRGLRLLNRMVVVRPEALVCHAGLQILAWAKNNPAFDLERLIALERHASPALRALSGLIHAQRAALNDQDNTDFTAKFDGSPFVRRVAGYLGSHYVAANPEEGRVSNWLVRLFNDPDARVREECLAVDWGALLDRPDSRTELVSTYIASPCFEARSDRLMMALNDRVSRFPDLALEGARRAITLAPSWEGEAAKGHFTTLHRMGRLLMALYQTDQGDPDREAELLDLFDDYLARDVYDLRKEVDALERH